jgi:hypothetical protein
MRAIVVYESMYGNTRLIAQAIGAGLATDAAVLPVGAVRPEAVDAAELIVVGGPTHIFGLSRPGSRKTAVVTAAKPASVLVAEPGADGIGLREWLPTIAGDGVVAAAFDTRLRSKFSGRASKRIAKLLTSCGFELVAPPESFFVTKANRLESNELDRARSWGRQLGAILAARAKG